jgi:hypothetical protein
LDQAFLHLEDACAADWPAGVGMLRAILASARMCEDKLAEVSDKAGSLLALDTPAELAMDSPPRGPLNPPAE